MPLDISAPRKNVTATLHYLQRTAQRPVRYAGEPPPGAVAWNGIDDPRDVLIEDGRDARRNSPSTATALPCCAPQPRSATSIRRKR
jgi:hypothetical protein